MLDPGYISEASQSPVAVEAFADRVRHQLEQVRRKLHESAATMILTGRRLNLGCQSSVTLPVRSNGT